MNKMAKTFNRDKLIEPNSSAKIGNSLPIIVSSFQSLLLVYAQLIQTQLLPVINFLSSVPGPKGESALHFVMTEWVARQPMFYGNYESKVRGPSEILNCSFVASQVPLLWSLLERKGLKRSNPSLL